jgi:hypothetical protein
LITNIDEIGDIDARIVQRSLVFTGSFSIPQASNLLLEMLAFRIKFFKSLRGLKVKQVFKLIEGTDRISEVFGESKIFNFGYELEVLKFLADSLMDDKSIIFYMGSSKKEGGFLGLALIPTALLFSKNSRKSSFSKVQRYIQAKISLSGRSEEILKKTADQLKDILSRELGRERWNEILEMEASSGLLRSESVKSWPLVKDTIYTVYTLLLPIYPTRAHVYGRKKQAGEKAKYPKALLRDLVQLFQEHFPEDLMDLTEKNVISCIQYCTGGEREGKFHKFLEDRMIFESIFKNHE